MRFRFLAVLACLVSFGAATTSCSSGSPAPTFVRLTGPMPEISGTTIAGRSFGRADYRGKVVVVNFWNQDCPPCREEQPVLEAASQRLSARGVIVVGLVYVGGNWPNDPPAALAFLTGNGVTYPNLLDAGSRLAKGFGISGIPTTVIAGRDGRLAFRILGKVRSGQLDGLVDQLD